MAGYFKKKRDTSGPNKNEQKVMRARQAENQAGMAGALRSKFPQIKSLRIHLQFLDAKHNVIEEKKMELGPADAAVFTVPCPGRCGRGSFDFGVKIAATVAEALAFSESSAKCAEPLYAGSPDSCAVEVRCRMDMLYFPKEEAPATTDIIP